MTILNGFTRVSRRTPCPVCGKPDWCLLEQDSADNPVRVLCARTESDRRWGEAGWLHVLRDDRDCARPRRHRTKRGSSTAPPADLSGLARAWQAALTDRGASILERNLGVGRASLRRLGLGWTGSAWSIPMYGEDGIVCGIQRRFPDGAKRTLRGSRLGLFLPQGLKAAETLFALEGASDTASFLDLGFDAVGRPNASAGAKLVVRLVQTIRPQHVVVVADPDRPGRSGAVRLAAQLRVVCQSVRILEPGGGAKDARAWVSGGATATDVQAAVEREEPLNLGVTVRRRARG